jgi:hypothetical protein
MSTGLCEAGPKLGKIYLMLVATQGYSDVNDMGVSLQNRGCGLLTFQTKYDYPICRRLFRGWQVMWS